MGKDDKLMHQAPLSAVLAEAAEPHENRGKEIVISAAGAGGEVEPVILRRPEVIHGLRNLIQNAVDFATSTVWIDLAWNENRISIKVADDGPGFPPHLMGKLGDPFLRRGKRTDNADLRPEYEGMGLGLFIARTLLERTGAELRFANGKASGQACSPRCGAITEVVWRRGDDRIEAAERSPTLSRNEPFEI